MNESPTGTPHELGREAVELKRSAKAVERSTSELVDEADRRTVLATDRTLLAAERTYAAWVRTALAALASGVGARALLKDVLPGWAGKLTATVLILFAAFCLIAAVWREIRGIAPPPAPDIPRMSEAILVPVNGVLLLVAIAALVGIWAS